MSLELLLGPQLEQLVARGFEVVGASAPGPYVERLEARGVRHVPLLHATRRMAPAEDLRAIAELVRCFRSLRPSIVHTHNPKPGIYGRVAARIARVPVIVNTVHGLYALPEDPPIKRAVVYGLERLAAACSDAELLQNEEDLPILRRLGVPERRLTILGNGIDLHRFDPGAVSPTEARSARGELGAVGPDDVVVGSVGRLVREKGYPELFEAAAQLRDACTPGARRGDRSGRSGQSRWTRTQTIAPWRCRRMYGSSATAMTSSASTAGMDVLVLASHREGFPRGPMEAAAMGLPVVATDIRGCRQAVEHGVTGFLVPPRDPTALADAIATLAGDSALRTRMGAAARKKAVRRVRSAALHRSDRDDVSPAAGSVAPRRAAESVSE